MLRNREFLGLVIGLGFATVTLPLGALLFGVAAACYTGGAMLIVDGIAIGYTICRYRELAKLVSYLESMRTGHFPLDIRDNREGELSILKNDIYKLTLTLSEQSELLRKDKKYLADALADISHQLKTPLTSITIMTDLLSAGNLSPEKRTEFTANIAAQLERIEWLITSLLKLSRIDAGAVTFRSEQIPAAELVRRAAEPLLVPMELRSQSLEVEGAPETTVTGDLNWTTEALSNILKNCVEHTPEGGTISIRYAENPLHTEIVVEDNGCGIDPHDLPHIFERFYRGQNASPDSVGIGLAMARTILLNQDADVSAENRSPEPGARFTLRFFKQIV